MATQAEVREFISQVRKRGYKVTKAGLKHHKVLTAKGSVVVDDHGPLIISATPSDANWRDMAVQRFRRAGVFADDPYKSTRGKKGVDRDGDDDDGGKQSQEDERKQREREATTRAARVRGDDFRSRSRELRAQVERMAVRLGGWNRTGGPSSGAALSMVDFVTAARYFADQSDGKHPWPTRTGIPTSLSAATQALYTLRQPDKTIGGTWLPLLEAFVGRLYEADPNDPGLAATRFRAMVAAARGEPVEELPTRRSPVVPGAGVADPTPEDVAEPDEPDEETGESETEPEVVLPPPRILPRRSSPTPAPTTDVVRAPTLSLKALYFMARGSEDGQLDFVLKLAEQLVEMELNSPAERARRTRSSE